ncbi:MFS transporter [Lactobacillus sp. CBA3605]|uniref:MFS transporter n=1 Tax=Lactobacillus sp. CBA3605 TaxID=2099788 RepID=UPI000CFCAA21|nr:MFS transporter [Lactobacillus sp. CBA3605]AVK61151.1 MFS transporter [Lactobacillus sp. CBA3605]
MKAEVDLEVNQTEEEIPLFRKLSYSLTDFGGNLLFVSISTYLLYFYTDVFGIGIGVAGTILLVTRCLDMIDAPVWGFLIDHTHTRWGQSRPYFLWLCVPFAIFTWLTFTTPSLTGTNKIIYAALTYVVSGILYTGISTPMTSILPNLTRDPEQRTKLNSYRMVGGNLGLLIANSIVLPLVQLLGQGNDRKGFSYTLLILGGFSILSFLLAFYNLREVNTVAVKSISLKQSVSATKSNWPWILIVITNLFYWIGTTVRSSGMIYYFQYNIQAKGLIPIAGGLSAVAVIGMILIPLFVKKTNKRTVFISALFVAAGANMLFQVVGRNQVAVVILYCIGSIGTGVAAAMPFLMLADAVDFGQWKNGIRASGFLTSIGSAFCVKAGSGIGGFIPSKVMQFFGYIPNHIQDQRSLLGINISFVWLPALLFIMAAIPMFFYAKYEKNEATIRADLKTAAIK